MITFTQSQLYDAVQHYVRNQEALLADANASVIEWKYADEEMFGLFPLFNEIGFRGDNKWQPAQRAWYASKPSTFSYAHGFDVQGNVRLIQRGAGALEEDDDRLVHILRFSREFNDIDWLNGHGILLVL